MDILTLRYFITVAECLNFTKAAKLLYTTQPNLSRQIMKLEEELGVKLLNRANNKVSLTEEGKVCLETAGQIVHHYDLLLSQTRSNMGMPASSLRIGYWYGAKNMLSDVIKELRLEYPRTQTSLYRDSLSALVNGLYEGKLDVIFSFDTEFNPMPGLKSEIIKKNQLQVVIPANHRLAGRTSIKLAEISKEDFIFTRRKESPEVFDNLINICINSGFSPNIVSYYEDINDMQILVSSEQGIAFSGLLVQKEVINENVLLLNVEDSPFNFDLTLMWREDNDNPIIPIFVEKVKASL